MEVKSKLKNGTLFISLSGELDEYSANYTRESMDQIISNTNFTKLIIDMGDLEFMDSTGIGVLIGRYKKLKTKNKSMYVINPTIHIERIFQMSGLYEIIPKIG